MRRWLLANRTSPQQRVNNLRLSQTGALDCVEISLKAPSGVHRLLPDISHTEAAALTALA